MAATACAAPLALRAAAVAPTRGVRSGVGKMAPRPRHRRAVRSAAVATASGARNQKPATLGSTFTTWLLKEEVEGRVDGELAIVLSSVALACKQVSKTRLDSATTNQRNTFFQPSRAASSLAFPFFFHVAFCASLTVTAPRPPPSPRDDERRSPARCNARASRA